jgi:hypothetical protein
MLRDAAVHEGCCGGGCDCCGPAEFVRLRYYFGQRLGVMELSEAQSYVVAKQRFHNLRLHGAGVVCGLTADRFVFPQNAPANTPATVLRVRRGAALDACGREVLAGSDQCIDVAAWFARHRTEADLKAWKGGEAHSLWVGLRYRECPSDPSPAPRDPCGCDAGGTQFGRVREGFELALLTDSELKAGTLGAVFPTSADILAALDAIGTAGGAPQRLEKALAGKVGQACPEGSCEGWLCLAKFDAILTDKNGTPVVTDISAPDNAIPERRSLLNTAALQELVADLASAAAGDGLTGAGPTLGALSFVPGQGGGPDTLRLEVHLISEGTPAVPTALAGGTVLPGYFKLMSFDTSAPPATAAWKDITPPAADIHYVTTPAPAFTLALASGNLTAGAYRLTLVPPPEAPIVDMKVRPLRPSRPARAFQLKTVDGTLTLIETPFPL